MLQGADFQGQFFGLNFPQSFNIVKRREFSLIECSSIKLALPSTTIYDSTYRRSIESCFGSQRRILPDRFLNIVVEELLLHNGKM